LLAVEGVGPKTIRALALVAEVIYGAKPSYKDPARYSFAHGGKDGTPYGIDRDTYDKTIATLVEAVGRSGISSYEKDRAISRLVTHKCGTQLITYPSNNQASIKDLILSGNQDALMPGSTGYGKVKRRRP